MVEANASLIGLVGRIEARQVVDRADGEAIDRRFNIFRVVFLATLLPAVVATLMWLHRANRNLRPLGANELRFTPKWAVGWFFVPILNLVRPYQAMSEIWRASDSLVDLAADGTAWKRARVSPLVGLWWAAWLAAGLVGNLAAYLAEPKTLDAIRFAAIVRATSLSLQVVAGLILMVLIHRINRNQEEKNSAGSSPREATLRPGWSTVTDEPNPYASPVAGNPGPTNSPAHGDVDLDDSRATWAKVLLTIGVMTGLAWLRLPQFGCGCGVELGNATWALKAAGRRFYISSAKPLSPMGSRLANGSP